MILLNPWNAGKMWLASQSCIAGISSSLLVAYYLLFAYLTFISTCYIYLHMKYIFLCLYIFCAYYLCRTGTKLHSLLQKLQVIKEEYRWPKKTILWLLKWKIKKTLPRPTFWCYESRLQTILASLVKKILIFHDLSLNIVSKYIYIYIYLDTFHFIELLTLVFAG